MRKTICLLLLAAAPAAASTVSYNLADKNKSQQIRFISEAPMENVEGTADQFSGFITFDPDRPEAGLSGMLRVQVDGMQTGLALRDTHMKSAEWLNAAAAPVIQFSPDSDKTKVKRKNATTWFVNAVGTFSLKGQSREITIPLTMTRKQSGKRDELLIKGRFNVRLADYGIQGPPAMKMIGARVGEEVRIDLNVLGLR